MSELKEVAEALSKCTDLIRPVVDEGVELIDSLLGKPCRVAGNLIADQIYAWQWSNRLRICAKAKRMLQGTGVPRKVMPAGFLLPLLDACGNCDDDTIQEMWAALIAGASQDTQVQHPLFIDALRRLAPEDSRAFARIATDMLGPPESVGTPDGTWAFNYALRAALGTGLGSAWAPPEGCRDLVPAIWHLDALGIVRVVGMRGYGDKSVEVPLVMVTGFGAQLWGAVGNGCPRAMS